MAERDEDFAKEPASAGGVRLKRAAAAGLKDEADLKALADALPGRAWDRIYDILSGKVSFDH